MKYMYVLVTDGNRAIATLKNSKLELPSHKEWPVHKAQPKINWPQKLIAHVLYGNSFAWPKPIKPKKTFGLPEKTSWAIFKIDKQDFTKLAKQAKSSAQWFFRNANAKVPWTLKFMKLSSLKDLLDPIGCHCIREFLSVMDE
jgi:hypothetical protein